MKNQHKQVLRILNFLPGILILLFSMSGLYAIVEHDELYDQILKYSELKLLSTTDPLRLDKKIEALHSQLDFYEEFVYWSMIAVGFSGFLLFILNTDKVNKLNELNDEKLQSLKLLQDQLAALEATTEGIGIVDAEGNLTYINEALMKIHGLAEDDRNNYIGKPWGGLYSDKGKEEIELHVLPEVERNGVWHGVSPILKKDGSVVTVDLSISKLANGGMIGTIRDISDKEKAAEEKKVLEQQFFQAQKMEAIGRLAGGVAHDFNNILAAINGYAEFLVEDLEEGSDHHHFARNIYQAGRQAKDVVDQILGFSRQKQSTKDKLNIMLPIKETLSMLKASIPKSIEVTQDLQADQTCIDGNSTQIAQVLMNLCVNAKDAIEDTKKEEGVIKVASKNLLADSLPKDITLSETLLAPDTPPPIKIAETDSTTTRLTLGALVYDKNYICISVEDTGSGMSLAIMERVFEPFFTTKAVDRGTGLGLATVHGVISGHQGCMVIESTIDKGTRFDLYFPLADMHDEEDELETQNYQEFGEGRILVVEDEFRVQQMLITMLERLGYEAHCVDSGDEALDILTDEPDYFDLVLTDQNMPKMTGLELSQRVYLESPEIPFILVSGYSEEKLQDLMKEHPAIKATMRKPVSKEKLSQKIADVLSASRLMNAA